MLLRPFLATSFATALLAGLSVAVFAPAASAQNAPPREEPEACLEDADCAEGQFCALRDCAPCDLGDEECEPNDCLGSGICITDEPPPAECSSDADCTDGNVCFAQTFESCQSTGCDCAPDETDCACDVPEEPECKVETYASCVPQYVLPCEAAVDCGAGFVCEEIQDCICRGGGGTDDGTDDNGPEDGEAPPETDCECNPSDGGGVCVLERVSCTTDEDCPIEGFECVDEESAAPCTVDTEGNVDCDDDTSTERICAPVGFNGGGVTVDSRAETGSTDDQPVDDPTFDDDVVFFNCSSASSASGFLPFLGLAFALRRRRR